MQRLAAIARTGVVAACLHPLRSAVTVACVVAILLPFVAGSAISRGLRDQAEDSVREGADLYVAGRRLGRDAPVPLALAETIRALPGVTDVVPRIVGEIRLGVDAVPAVLVGVTGARVPVATTTVQGRLFQPDAPGELVVGRRLAKRLALVVGSKIPPFYRNDAGERVSTVVGVFESHVPIWEANLVFTSFQTAAAILEQRDLASSLLVSCAPDACESVRLAVLRLPPETDAHGPLRLRVTSREDVAAVLSRDLLSREGLLDLHFVLAFALGIPLVLLTTGVGLVERRRETGLLKATGWQTDEVLVRSLGESLLLAVLGASIAIVAAWVWLVALGGVGIAPVFLDGIDASPGVDVPFRLAPVPALLAFVVSFVVVGSGSVLSSWRAASAPPAEAMR